MPKGTATLRDSVQAPARAAGLACALLALLLYASLSIAPATSEAAQRCFGKRATIVGTKKAERLRGTRRADVIWAAGGRDRLIGLGGRDRLCGGAGNDRLLGGNGSDRLDGGRKRDICNLGSETTLAFRSCERFPLTVTGKVSLDTGGGAGGSRVKVSGANALGAPTVRANSAGTYRANLTVTRLPAALKAEISFAPAGLPSADTARRTTARSNTPGFSSAVVPNIGAAELTLAGGSAQSADGGTQISNAPGEIDRIFARSYDPGPSAAAFPGTFTEDSGLPLNSSLFTYVAALDSAGNEVHNLSSPITIRVRVFNSQLKDLVDLEAGTDRIEIPIFSFDEASDQWKQESTGWLEDAAGGLIPEDAQAEVLSGDFPGEVFARFETDHLSYVNLDYPYFGPYDISSVDPDERRNECLGPALDLANTILFSQAGLQSLQQFNLPGADIKQELPDGVIKLSVDPQPAADPDFAFGWFDPQTPGEIHLNKNTVSICDSGGGTAVPQQTIDSMTVFLAATIVHEVAHWKWHNYHEGGDPNESEPGGHGGWVIEEDLFNGILAPVKLCPTCPVSLELNDQPVSQSQVQQWLNPGFWPQSAAGPSSTGSPSPAGSSSPLDISISVGAASFNLGQQITATVDYHNGGGQPIEVLDVGELPGMPVWFEFQGPDGSVPFIGRIDTTEIDFGADFTTIAPGQTIQRSFDLINGPEGTLYNLITSGNYDLTAHYSPAWGLAPATSNTVSFSVNPGGSVGGNVTDETTGLPLDEVVVRALEDGQVRDQTQTDFQGDYSFDELPSGTYTIDAKKLGYLKTTEPNVVVTDGNTTTRDLTLAPLVASDGIRLVLTWSALADDLDAHLWLPASKPFHVAFFRRGDLGECPFANLDIDIISQGGPETMTIGQLFGGDYLYAVHKFSGPTDLSASAAQVRLYDAGGDLLNTYNVPNTGTEEWWELLQIDGDTGQVTPINTLGGDPAPYADTSSGCA